MPFTFIGTVLVWLLTRNVTKALSVLMVAFSCALKLAMPVTVLSAIREANAYGITVKGGKFLEKTAAAIAREIADVTISENDLGSILTLRKLSTAMMKRIHRNYRAIISVNSGLIVLGVTGLVQPTATAMLHNASTLGIGLLSTKRLLSEKQQNA